MVRRSRSSVGARRATGAGRDDGAAFLGWLLAAAAGAFALVDGATGFAATDGFGRVDLRAATRAVRRGFGFAAAFFVLATAFLATDLLPTAFFAAAFFAAAFLAPAFLDAVFLAAFFATFLTSVRLPRGAGFEARRRACFFVLAIAHPFRLSPARCLDRKS